LFSSLLGLAVLSLRAAGVQPQHLYRHEGSRMSMACLYTIEAYGPDADAMPHIANEAFDEVDRIDRLMSHYKAESPLSRINAQAAQHPVAVDPELFDFIAEALRYTRVSHGAFDITVGPLMKAWGFFRGEGRVPADAELAAVRRHVGAEHVVMDPAARTIAFDGRGVSLDLGGIAKGYAVDRVVKILKQRRIAAALISAGGSTIYGLGAPPGRDGWQVQIQDPIDARKIARTVTLKDRALSVAGTSEKSFEADGVRYSHIMDPRTGRPVQGVLSVAVLSDTGTAGDALDDALFVLGPRRSRELLPGTEAFFFLPDGAGSWTVEHLDGVSKVSGDLEAMPFAPRHYVAYRAAPRPTVDGQLDDPAWTTAPWTDGFVDIEGDSQPRPRFRTHAKMLWDDEYFYVGAEMEEPDVWGTLTARDSIIFHDNDFEIFIDPDGDTHAYYELEVNALGTPWDLLLIKPYRDGGPAIHAWDIAGLQVGIHVAGTVNRPGDRDDGWTVEIAMPWKILREAAPDHTRPRSGDRWRVNFSRVEWDVDVSDGRYLKRLRAGTTDPLPEHDWVWSAQGAIDMHMPERWGYVQFSNQRAGSGTEPFIDDPNERLKWALRRLYYRQRRYREVHGGYALALEALNAGDIRVEGLRFQPAMAATSLAYHISANGFDGAAVHIDQDGRVWTTRRRNDP
jgi:thiamine biosynthesis lipoprotein ApbE